LNYFGIFLSRGSYFVATYNRHKLHGKQNRERRGKGEKKETYYKMKRGMEYNMF